MSNETDLQKFREVLLPTVPYRLAADPMKVAWDFNGVEIEYLPRNWTYRWYRGGNSKLLLLAIATLQAQGIPATRASIVKQLGGTLKYTTVGANLARMTNIENSWSIRRVTAEYRIITPIPLVRVKRGRRFEYYITEPVPPTPS